MCVWTLYPCAYVQQHALHSEHARIHAHKQFQGLSLEHVGGQWVTCTPTQPRFQSSSLPPTQSRLLRAELGTTGGVTMAVLSSSLECGVKSRLQGPVGGTKGASSSAGGQRLWKFPVKFHVSSRGQEASNKSALVPPILPPQWKGLRGGILVLVFLRGRMALWLEVTLDLIPWLPRPFPLRLDGKILWR